MNDVPRNRGEQNEAVDPAAAVLPRPRADEFHSETALAELIYDYGRFSVDRWSGHFAKLDQKAISLGGFVGVMLTIMLTLAPQVFMQGKWAHGFAAAAQVFYIFGVLCLFVSITFCGLAIRLRITVDCAHTADVVERAKSLPGDETAALQLRHFLITEMARNQRSLFDQAAPKERQITVSLWTWICGIVLLLVSGLSFVVHTLSLSY